ncbi:sigma-70 family RNA polymerase sigma factor [Corynebacterium poyangense]|uniref:Sigma-70 family RNA polymerase sigma factor n=1 Tax=Corynebacterium poyangense TaxID=2684405 RepID=A0A7H0SRI3_9CORY|nr:sigma-70 family RNA polymerase sigma factor [Corynebacterium poyangense]QNQ91158.1 sigma-70 family RNA polymerase sigma factor [Corynebacterium poyangense]
MATEPNTYTVQLFVERTQKASERYPTRLVSYRITVSEAEVMVERDLAIRRAGAENPDQIGPRTIEQIADELGKQDYNNAKKQLRHTTYRSASGRDDEEDVSIIDVSLSREGEDPAQKWMKVQAVRDVLARMDTTDREVLIAIHMHGYTQTEVAKWLGVSQPAVAKRLSRAEEKFQQMWAEGL